MSRQQPVLSNADLVWVSFKSIDHQAWIIEMDDDDDEVLVKWQMTGLLDWVPISSIQHELPSRRRRQERHVFCSFEDFRKRNINSLWKQVKVHSRIAIKKTKSSSESSSAETTDHTNNISLEECHFETATVIQQKRKRKFIFRIRYDDVDEDDEDQHQEWMDLSQQAFCLLDGGGGGNDISSMSQKTTTVTAPPNNEQLPWNGIEVGSRVAVYWGGDKTYYNATVVPSSVLNKSKSIFCLHYDDGEVEELDLSQNQYKKLLLESSSSSGLEKESSDTEEETEYNDDEEEEAEFDDDNKEEEKEASGGGSAEPSSSLNKTSKNVRRRQSPATSNDNNKRLLAPQEEEELDIGSRISVYWKDDDEYYKATVVQKKSKKKKKDEESCSVYYHLLYDDGEEEELDLSKEIFQLLVAEDGDDANDSDGGEYKPTKQRQSLRRRRKRSHHFKQSTEGDSNNSSIIIVGKKEKLRSSKTRMATTRGKGLVVSGRADSGKPAEKSVEKRAKRRHQSVPMNNHYSSNNKRFRKAKEEPESTISQQQQEKDGIATSRTRRSTSIKHKKKNSTSLVDPARNKSKGADHQEPLDSQNTNKDARSTTNGGTSGGIAAAAKDRLKDDVEPESTLVARGAPGVKSVVTTRKGSKAEPESTQAREESRVKPVSAWKATNSKGSKTLEKLMDVEPESTQARGEVKSASTAKVSHSKGSKASKTLMDVDPESTKAREEMGVKSVSTAKAAVRSNGSKASKKHMDVDPKSRQAREEMGVKSASTTKAAHSNGSKATKKRMAVDPKLTQAREEIGVKSVSTAKAAPLNGSKASKKPTDVYPESTQAHEEIGAKSVSTAKAATSEDSNPSVSDPWKECKRTLELIEHESPSVIKKAKLSDLSPQPFLALSHSLAVDETIEMTKRTIIPVNSIQQAQRQHGNSKHAEMTQEWNRDKTNDSVDMGQAPKLLNEEKHDPILEESSVESLQDNTAMSMYLQKPTQEPNESKKRHYKSLGVEDSALDEEKTSSHEDAEEEAFSPYTSSRSAAKLLFKMKRVDSMRKRLTGPRKKRILKGYEMEQTMGDSSPNSNTMLPSY
eukprot:scaffold530_cov107-Cylindrotheca_fusiformis.AAC.10